jgi:two-component system, NtrC family, response regulator AtoC
VFLDEVGELSPGTQAKLLRVLEERVVTRLGSNRARPVDVRIVAATNRDIEAEGTAGRFRQDLFFRLNGISLLIPPLRERREEIESFARMFVATACRGVERTATPLLSPEALDMLREHEWKGNVRELRNAIERAVALCPGDTILPEHLPPALFKATEARRSAAASLGRPPAENGAVGLSREIETLEKRRILDTLASCAGNQTQAARRLGISRGTLIARLAAFGVPRPRKRDDAPEG